MVRLQLGINEIYSARSADPNRTRSVDHGSYLIDAFGVVTLASINL